MAGVVAATVGACTLVAVAVLTVQAALVVSAEASASFAPGAAVVVAARGADRAPDTGGAPAEAGAPARSSADQPAAPPPPAAPPEPVVEVAAAAGDPTAIFTADLVAVGASGFTLSDAWASCGQPDKGPRQIQGCARSDDPTVIIMKPIDAEVAGTQAARGVVLHEWSHVVQFRLGYAAVVQAADQVYGPGRGLEESADCMAIQLGALGAPGGYTSDCTGARGELAAAFLAGRLS